ncbi:hypothetical protein BKA67DRAFT_534259 [Truncatella angustata]|uniref:Uncharacterized protein n=1 Tax=Truncatella angustata TaxID=152316 RepID=A0A9P8ZZT1_9PEZI|nr:uncharacterized protein BKA67DRAFT_534259 [Truncatella angustata]KAH6655329.1 hypothetical protein BKA67DRAFT_534259 [Truncatella angustata]
MVCMHTLSPVLAQVQCDSSLTMLHLCAQMPIGPSSPNEGITRHIREIRDVRGRILLVNPVKWFSVWAFKEHSDLQAAKHVMPYIVHTDPYKEWINSDLNRIGSDGSKGTREAGSCRAVPAGCLTWDVCLAAPAWNVLDAYQFIGVQLQGKKQAKQSRGKRQKAKKNPKTAFPIFPSPDHLAPSALADVTWSYF